MDFLRFADGIAKGGMIHSPFGVWPPPDTIVVRRDGSDSIGVTELAFGPENMVWLEDGGCEYAVYERDPEATSKLTEEDLTKNPFLGRGAEYHQMGEAVKGVSAPDAECYTTPDGDCIAENCKLHGPLRSTS